MKPTPFEPPSLETMGALLPALEFTAIVASNHVSAVYLARQRSLDRDVALKILAPRISEDAEFQGLFKSAASSMAQLNHPNLIRVFDSGCVEGMLYFVMEFVPGKPLAHSMDGTPVDLKQAVGLFAGICAGLAHAHGHGLIHGALNPSNILLTPKAEPKIGNLGIPGSSEPGTVSEANARYVAPENLNSTDQPDRRSDIYAAGAILYELLTGRAHAANAEPPSKLSSCGTRMDHVWLQATHPAPDQRFQDAETFAAAVADAVSAPQPPRTAVLLATQRPATGGVRRPISPAVRPALRKKAPADASPKLVRNLCIISVLLVAISVAWINLKKARAANDHRNREILAANQADKERAEETRRKALEARKNSRLGTDSSDDAASRPQIAETPEESLARLRADLVSGKRDEMPDGATRKGDCHYLLITEPMTWPDAAWFAEQHGGHLAAPGAAADLAWLAGHAADKQAIWIGAASSGRHAWALADGTTWTPDKKPTGVGHYIASDKFGFLRAETAPARHPFLIQWHQDGSNPGALAELLAATHSSLSQPDPVFPPGTRTFGSRHYLFVSRPLAWRDAADTAESAGGYLAVPSETAEFIGLEEMAANIVAENGIWLGGFLKGDHWLWITGEPWQTAKWAEGTDSTQADSAMSFRPDDGWCAQHQSEPASGFIIEWSQDVKSTLASKPKAPAPAGKAANLDQRARGLIADADSKRTEQLAANIKKLSDDLGVYLRGLGKNEQDEWTAHIDRLKSTIKHNRLPDAIPSSSGIHMSKDMDKLFNHHSQKQDKIDLEFHAEVEKIRVAYVARLRKAKTESEQSGQSKVAASIEQSLQIASNLADWVQSYDVELQPENPSVADRLGKNRMPASDNGASRID